MCTDGEELTSVDKRLAAVIAEYLQDQEAGKVIDRDRLLARYPDVAREFAGFLDSAERFEQMIAPLKNLDVSSLLSESQRVAFRQSGNGPDLEPTKLPCDFGGYELIEEIARGGMGVVYRARQKALDRVVALKTIRDGRFACDDEAARFQREAASAASLEHPSIVPIYESGQSDGRFYYSMQLIDGHSLAHYKDQLRGDGKRIAALLEEVARAIHFAHLRGILHCDLKPGNILIDRAGRAHITDFGLARRVETHSQRDWSASGTILGTPNYMAPEQVFGCRQFTTAVDVHAMGAILYELITGVPPFHAEHPLEVLLSIREREPLRPSVVHSDVDLDLETISLKCLAKDPNDRYRSAEEFADELKRWAGGEAILARPVRKHRQVIKWLRRKPQFVALILTTMLALAAAGAALATFVGNIKLGKAYDEVTALRTISENERRKAESSFEVARRYLYYYQINDAQQNLAGNRAGAAASILQDTPIDLRSWEWHYLKRLADATSGRDQADASNRADVFTGKHPRAVYGMAWSPDGNKIASASSDNSVRIWDISQRREHLELIGHNGYVDSVAYSPSGLLIASASFDHTVRLWDAKTGYNVQTLVGHEGPVNTVVFHPTMHLLASGGTDGTVRLWRTSGEPIGILCRRRMAVVDLAINKEGDFLAVAYDDGQIEIWEADTRRLQCTVNTNGALSSVAFSPSGDRLAAGGRDDGQITIWEVSAKTDVLNMQARFYAGAVRNLTFTHDGRRIISIGKSRTVDLWDPTNGRRVFSLPCAAQVAALSPDGFRLAWGSRTGTVGICEGQ